MMMTLKSDKGPCIFQLREVVIYLQRWENLRDLVWFLQSSGQEYLRVSTLEVYHYIIGIKKIYTSKNEILSKKNPKYLNTQITVKFFMNIY
jgi:hypothetical protein